MLQTLPARPQQPGGRGVRTDGKKSILGDPGKLFDILSKGSQTLSISNAGPMRSALAEYARQQGILGDLLTREQFADFSQALTMQSLLRQGKSPGTAKSATPDDGMDQRAEWAFNRRDVNGDGFLDLDEMDSNLRDNLAYWDRNGDGVISLREYKIYFRWRMEDRQNRALAGVIDAFSPHSHERTPPDLSELDQRPIVYRRGHLPAELPQWFTDLDVDEDGQIGLYEWRKSGKSAEEFLAMDRNGDGLLTAEELLYFMSK
jgi:Ca2+-binding EF-hand superfamily protein